MLPPDLSETPMTLGAEPLIPWGTATLAVASVGLLVIGALVGALWSAEASGNAWVWLALITSLAFSLLGTSLWLGNSRLSAKARICHLFLDNIQDPISIWTTNGRLLNFNPAARRAFSGLHDSDLKSLVWYDIDWRDIFRARATEAFRNAAKGQAQVFQYYSDVSKRWWDVVLQPIVGPGGTPSRIHASARDISELKEGQDKQEKDRDLVEARLKQAQLAAEAANQAKTSFLAHMSHEIRNPIGVMIGFAEILRTQAEVDPDKVGYLEAICRNGQNVLSIINDLLDLSKVEANRLELERIEFDLVNLIQETTESMQVKAVQRGIVLQVEYGQDLPAVITNDPARLRQILVNLLSNAIKFTPQGSVTLGVTACTREQGPCLEFTVTDTGCGIRADQREIIFESFSQADPSISRKYGGTGLGLSLSKSLAQAMGGDVSLKWTEVGKGSTFIATVSFEAVDSWPESARAKPEIAPVPVAVALVEPGKEAEPKRRVPHVCFVDDEPEICNLYLMQFRKLVQKGVCKVSCVRSGQACLNLLNSGTEDIDLVITDLNMPDMDGYELLATLCRQFPRIKRQVSSAYSDRGHIQKALAAGAQKYYCKPLKIGEIEKELTLQC